MGEVRVTCPFLFLAPIIFGIGKARHFKFRVLIDILEYYCMRDRLPTKGMCSGSRDLLKFGIIIGNISKTVQNKHIGLVAIDD